MNQLAFIKHDDVFTDSWIVAQNIGRDHKSVTYNIRKFKSRFESAGNLASTTRQINEGAGRPTIVYDLNEAQAVFLISLMDNSEKVLDFKMALALDFVRMRRLLLHRQSAEWQQARLEAKDFRKMLNDTIKELAAYAESQGSTHSDRLYVSYAKLVKGLAGYESLDLTDALTLSTVTTLLRILRGIIIQEVMRGAHYKAIYQTTKVRLTEMTALMNAPRLTA